MLCKVPSYGILCAKQMPALPQLLCVTLQSINCSHRSSFMCFAHVPWGNIALVLQRDGGAQGGGMHSSCCVCVSLQSKQGCPMGEEATSMETLV